MNSFNRTIRLWIFNTLPHKKSSSLMLCEFSNHNFMKSSTFFSISLLGSMNGGVLEKEGESAIQRSRTKNSARDGGGEASGRYDSSDECAPPTGVAAAWRCSHRPGSPIWAYMQVSPMFCGHLRAGSMFVHAHSWFCTHMQSR